MKKQSKKEKVDRKIKSMVKEGASYRDVGKKFKISGKRTFEIVHSGGKAPAKVAKRKAKK